jgi:hypothetical protein
MTATDWTIGCSQTPVWHSAVAVARIFSITPTDYNQLQPVATTDNSPSAKPDIAT